MTMSNTIMKSCISLIRKILTSFCLGNVFLHLHLVNSRFVRVKNSKNFLGYYSKNLSLTEDWFLFHSIYETILAELISKNYSTNKKIQPTNINQIYLTTFILSALLSYKDSFIIAHAIYISSSNSNL
jgi:hypothetical protein